MKGVHEWIDLPSLESIDLGMNSLLGRYNIPECALTMKSMDMHEQYGYLSHRSAKIISYMFQWEWILSTSNSHFGK